MRLALIVCCWVLAAAAELAAALVWLEFPALARALPLGLHGAAALLLATPLFRGGRPPTERVLAGSQALCLLLLPGLGYLVALWMGLRCRLAHRAGVRQAYEEYVAYRDELETAEGEEDQARTAGRIRSSLNIVPMVEIMENGSFAQKRQVIERVSRRPTREGVRLLQKALDDAHPDIRSYAAGGLARLEAQLTEEIQKAEIRVARAPGSVEARRVLGTRYFQYASLGTLDVESRRYYLERAIGALSQAIDRQSAQPDLLVRLGEALLMHGQPERALSHLGAALERTPEDARAWCLRTEAQFYTGAISAMLADARQALEHMDEVDRDRDPVWETLEWLSTSSTRA